MEEKSKINKFELRRQFFHALLGIIIVLLLMFEFVNKEMILAAVIFGLIMSYLSRKARIPVIWDMLQIFERKKELGKFPGKGIIFYFIGVYAALLLFPKDIAMASIMVLALGDSVSHLFGIHFGKTKHPLSKTKFLEGTIAGFIAGFIGALAFSRWHEALFASLAAMIVEAVEVKIGTEQVDDNLIVPIVAGGVIWLLRLV